jgi:hypothetical protein
MRNSSASAFARLPTMARKTMRSVSWAISAGPMSHCDQSMNKKKERYEPAASSVNTSVPKTPSAVAAETTGSSSTSQKWLSIPPVKPISRYPSSSFSAIQKIRLRVDPTAGILGSRTCATASAQAARFGEIADPALVTASRRTAEAIRNPGAGSAGNSGALDGQARDIPVGIMPQ